MKITGIESFLVEVPQLPPVAPYQSRIRAASSTAALLLRIETDRGIVGWGEAPQRYLGEQLTGREAIELRTKLTGFDPFDVEALYHRGEFDGEYVQSAVEMALWDIVGKAAGLPLYQLLGGAFRREIELAACSGIRPYKEAGEVARHYVEQGFSTLKTKAGRDPAEDLELVRGVRDAVGDRLKLRIDPNRGYSPEVCEQLARDLEPYNLQYLEQPMPADLIGESARIRGLTTTPLALNESVTTANVVREILDLKAADVLLPDTYQCGGIKAVKLIGDMATAAGVPCVMHCAHDLGLKTAAMLHIAASTASFSLANDCTYYSLEDDVLTDRLTIQRGRMSVPERPGLGVEVDPKRVRKYETASSG